MTTAEGSTSGHHRVAAFLLSLEREAAARVLKAIDPALVPQVARAMVELSPDLSKPGTADELWRALAVAVNGPRRIRAADEHAIETLMEATFGPERAKGVLAEIRRRRNQEHPFHAIERIPPARIARALIEESSPCIALVLAHLDPPLSGEIVKRLEKDKALDVIRRMATLAQPPARTLQAVADGLLASIEALADERPVPAPSERLKTVAELLSYSPPELEKGVIESLSEADADMANELREFLFTWEDIATIDKRSMQKILGTVDTKTLAVALKACTSAIEENMLGNLSQRVREMVAEERELVGAVPMTEVQSARDEIMKNIRAMIEAGEFSPSRKGEDLVA